MVIISIYIYPGLRSRRGWGRGAAENERGDGWVSVVSSQWLKHGGFSFFGLYKLLAPLTTSAQRS